MRILLIEDDEMLAAGLIRALGDVGIGVDWIRDGGEAELAMANSGYGAILLDLGLPGKSGMDLLRDHRKSGVVTPILIMTARDATDDRVAGLDLGADDYLVKPFHVSELLARIRAVLRRNAGHAVSQIDNGVISLDLASHEAIADGKTVVLPQREFSLLYALLERPGTVLTRAQIEERIYAWGEEVESNAVDALIYSLRRKLGKDVIRNLRGAGWMVPKSGL